jgi:hypothetical protein
MSSKFYGVDSLVSSQIASEARRMIETVQKQQIVIDRLLSGQVANDAKKMTETTQKQLVIKVGLIAAGVFFVTFLAGAALYPTFKFAGIVVILASPVLGFAAGAYAKSFFTKRDPFNQFVNFANNLTAAASKK